MTDTKQSKGAQIRQELKKQLGATSRQISVREDHNSIRITIKAEGFPSAKVKKIASQHESIDRCQYSGEILSGGNTYVFVSFADELVDKVQERIAESVKPIFEKAQTFPVGNGDTFTVEGVQFLLMNEGHSFEARPVKKDGELDYSVNRSYVSNQNANLFAHCIAQFMLGRQ